MDALIDPPPQKASRYASFNAMLLQGILLKTRDICLTSLPEYRKEMGYTII